jgi:D-amino-acid dehydrogenase
MSKTTSEKKKVVVIGGGAIGVATASWLLRDGHDVTLVEPGAIAMGSSFGNAGCLNASSIVPMSMPGNLPKVPGWLLDPLGPLSIRWRYLPTIAPWLLAFLRAGTREKVVEQAAALRPLLADSYGAYQPLVKAAGAQDLVFRNGHLVAYQTKEDFAGDTLGWKLRRDNGIKFDVLERDELWQQEPSLSHDYTVGVFLPDNGHTANPNRLISAFAAQFTADGGRIVKARATGFQRDGQRLTGVHTDVETIPADAAVLAAGAHSKPLTQQLGDSIPLDTERGYHVVIAQPEIMPRTSILDATGKFVATPMEMGLRLAGTVEFAGLDAAPDWRRARQLLTLGRRLFPGLAPEHAEEKLSVWMGFRPSIPDSLPVIGASRQCPDVFYAFGHGHVGLAAAATTGLVVSDLVAARPPRIPIAAFSPQRF